MILNDKVKLILFGGGYVGNELLPYLDFELIRKHPKIICSYSDGTTLLNSIYTRTGLTVYYGQTPGIFSDLRHYDYNQFKSHFMDGPAYYFESNSLWKTVCGGSCEGILVGGYTTNFARLLDSRYFQYDCKEKYLLFLEDHEKFATPIAVSSYLSHIEQSGFIKNVTGLLFGHYSEKVFPELTQRLERFGTRNHVPVAMCDDFGHGINHAILPIGCHARLDADMKSMGFQYS